MSPDEMIVLFVSVVAVIFGWGRWYSRALRVSPLGNPHFRRLPLYLMPLACLGLLLPVLTRWADPEVRGNGDYMVLFLAVGAVALLGMEALGVVVGISALRDGIERRNGAAAWAVCGAWLGMTLCVAGANSGAGPTIWTTLGPLVLAAAALAGLWLLFAAVTPSAASVAVNRNLASGVRLAGLLVAWGLVLGRAIAGDWVSIKATLNDFAAQAWPVLPLLAVAIVMEWLARPRKARPFPPLGVAGLVPAATYLGAAAGWLLWLGPWNGAGPS